jgi:glycosyltransferase involved in cell wall biosynthesis
MKLNVFSPLPPAHTEIANYTARMLSQLAERFELTVWSDTENPKINPQIPVRMFKEALNMRWNPINHADFNLYNIGNNERFHDQIVRIQHRSPGIVVQHDINLHELVCGMYLPHPNGRERYLHILHEHYGEEALRMGRQLLNGSVDMNEICLQYPMLDWVMGMPHGVVLHNSTQTDVVRAATRAPILVTPLPYLPRAELNPPQPRFVKAANKPFTLILFGFMKSTNRRLQPFLEALSGLPERTRFKIEIAGETADPVALKKQLKAMGMASQVRLHGFVSDQVLDQLLQEADLAINLRYPSRGEASASQLRLWNHSLPSLITRTGWYATLSESVVTFVDPEREIDSIREALTDFLQHPEVHYAKGLKGRALLESDHSVETFVDRLEQFLPEVAEYRKTAFAQPLALRLGRMLLSNIESNPLTAYASNRLAAELNVLSRSS